MELRRMKARMFEWVRMPNSVQPFRISVVQTLIEDIAFEAKDVASSLWLSLLVSAPFFFIPQIQLFLSYSPLRFLVTVA